MNLEVLVIEELQQAIKDIKSDVVSQLNELKEQGIELPEDMEYEGNPTLELFASINAMKYELEEFDCDTEDREALEFIIQEIYILMSLSKKLGFKMNESKWLETFDQD